MNRQQVSPNKAVEAREAGGRIEYIKPESLFGMRSLKARWQQYEVICNHCGDRLALIKSDKESVSGAFEFLSCCWHDDKFWHGTSNVNQNPLTLSINFECTCGNKEVVEPIKNLGPRYTVYKIRKISPIKEIHKVAHGN